ncbi:MAG: bifunctional metallophosphatase/5'-nucleotidase [Holophagaceae bacterium]|nr:bifunctional metallophosphatase/5'-nucleotidase [Holophagaceae bacterium]
MLRDWIVWLCWLITASILYSQDGLQQKIKIVATANTYAAILPQDPYSLAPVNRGWARLATALRAERASEGATLFVDCGDALLGEPMAYIQNRMHPTAPNPIIEIMNNIGYAAMVPGASDFNFGFPWLKSAERQARFPFVAANIFDSMGKEAFKPYIKVNVNGVSVAFLGLFIPVTPKIDQPGLFVRDALESAIEWVPRLRIAERADLVIAIVHTGTVGPFVASDDKNTARQLAEKVAGIDGIIAAQGLQPLSTMHAGVPIARPGAYGQSMASITFSLGRRGQRWFVQSASPANIPTSQGGALDPLAVQLTEQARADEESYLNTHATQLGFDLDGRWSTVEPTALVQLLHDVQKKVTGAQLSATPSPGPQVYIPKGATSVRQFYSLAPDENHIARIRITGAQLRTYLEHAARYFNFSHLPELINRSMPLADYDMIGGCSYSIDISRPPGRRVSELKYAGEDVRDSQVFTMAISTYRLAGGGGYMDAIGFNGQPEMVSRDTLRNSLLEFVLSAPTLSISAPTHWRTIPYLERERVLAAYKLY